VLDESLYAKGRKMSNKELAKCRIKRHKCHGEWNYGIQPRKGSSTRQFVLARSLIVWRPAGGAANLSEFRHSSEVLARVVSGSLCYATVSQR
jgi:hypothetical protein